jgi:hypothetical protein
VAHGAQGTSTQLLEVGDNGADLQKAPWLWGVFWRNSKQHPFAKLVIQTCLGNCEIIQGLPY